MDKLRQELIRLSNNAPLTGYVYSGNFAVLNLKEQYNVSDYYIVEILKRLIESGEIRDLDINYDIDDKHLLSYKFR